MHPIPITGNLMDQQIWFFPNVSNSRNDAKANTSSHFTWILYTNSRSSPHPNTFRKLKSHTNDAVDAYHVKTSTWNNSIPEQNRVKTSIVKEQKAFPEMSHIVVLWKEITDTQLNFTQSSWLPPYSNLGLIQLSCTAQEKALKNEDAFLDCHKRKPHTLHPPRGRHQYPIANDSKIM